MSHWSTNDMPRQDGRTAVVTGANSGIGLVAARELARAGARVILGVRDVAKGRRAAASIDGDSDVRALDLADLSSVRAFAEGLDGEVDVLVNNAGVMAVPYATTADGFEMQLGTNHLGHFALTGLLLDRIRDRVVTVSSTAHKMGRIAFDDLQSERSYKRWTAYGQSKLANLLFTLELQRRLEAAGSPVRSVAAHPGYAATNLQTRQTPPEVLVMKVLNLVVAQSDERGALPTLYAATVGDLAGGAFVGPSGIGEMRGHPTLVQPSGAAQDEVTAERLWDVSEELTGVTYGLAAAPA